MSATANSARLKVRGTFCKIVSTDHQFGPGCFCCSHFAADPKNYAFAFIGKVKCSEDHALVLAMFPSGAIASINPDFPGADHITVGACRAHYPHLQMLEELIIAAHMRITPEMVQQAIAGVRASN